MRIRTHLLLLTGIVLIPGLIAATVAVEKVRDGERRAAIAGLTETVRATALLVDGQIQRELGALGALAQSSHFRTGNLEAFHAQATATDQLPHVWTVVIDDTGTQVINTAVPFGTPPPPPEGRDLLEKFFRAGRPVVTGLRNGPVTRQLVTTVFVPAAPSAGRRLALAKTFSLEHWRQTVEQPRNRPELIVAVIDPTGRFIARTRGTEEYLGRQARPELVAAAAGAKEGVIRHRTLEGIEVYDAFTHSALTGWTIAVAAPIDSIEASATQAIAWLATGIAAALAVAVIGASMLNRVLIGSMDTAAAGARALGLGQRVDPPHTALDEVNGLNRALRRASDLLVAEKAARGTVEAERERLLANETAARQLAQTENAAKDKFLALLGHELRNPLAAISGAAELLARRAPFEAAHRRFLDIIQRQNKHLRHIVDDLLEVSRMLSGKIALEPQPLDLAACVSTCVDALRTSDQAAGHTLTLDAQPVWIAGDAVRLEQIVNNLVNNALKFSPTGSEIRVTLRAQARHAVLQVRDQGAGIEADFLPRMFEPFVQGRALQGRQQAGLGVGLALVKELVDLHGGTVTAASEGPGRGAVFTVTLPRIDAPAAAPEDGAGPAAATPVPARRRVLLVEDNADARDALSALLQDLGCDVVEAADGEQALRLATLDPPDLAVMDLGLPGLSGFEVATEFRRRDALRGVPLIALSGYGQARDREAALASGFDEHLAKPADATVLRATIERLIERGDPATATGAFSSP
ncbi:MAG: ATP-binding protein [Pseudomonadota bacterium]